MHVIDGHTTRAIPFVSPHSCNEDAFVAERICSPQNCVWNWGNRLMHHCCDDPPDLDEMPNLWKFLSSAEHPRLAAGGAGRELRHLLQQLPGVPDSAGQPGGPQRTRLTEFVAAGQTDRSVHQVLQPDNKGTISR